MITITIQDAISIHAAICKLPKLPAKLAYKFARVSEALRYELRELESYRRISSNEPERRKEMQQQMAGYLGRKVELDFDPIPIEEVAVDGVELQPHFLATLSPLISNGDGHG